MIAIQKWGIMYLYWRIQQDLTCLGEIIQFRDPALILSLRKWVRKNFTGLALAEGFFQSEYIRENLN